MEQSIDSIVSQTFSNWELIIVDDCSKDHTLEIAKRYEACDRRIRVIHNQTNKRLPASLNIGFREARGDYLTWTSDDNVYYPDALEVMSSYLQDNKDYPMVCTGMSLIDDTDNVIGEYGKYDETEMYYNACVGACFLYRTEVVSKIGEYDEGRFGIEDYEYWLRILEKYGKIGFIDSVHYLYRLHERSLTETRWREIKRELNRLRAEKFDFFFAHLEKSERLLCALYFDMLISDAVSQEKKPLFEEKLPILKRFVGLPLDEKGVILYGAGLIGDKAYKLLGSRVKYYADRSPDKIGMKKNDVEIISPEEMLKNKDLYHIVLSVGSDMLYQVATTLIEQGIEKLTTFQQLESMA